MAHEPNHKTGVLELNVLKKRAARLQSAHRGSFGSSFCDVNRKTKVRAASPQLLPSTKIKKLTTQKSLPAITAAQLANKVIYD